MADELQFGQHEWHNQTTLHPAGLAAVLILGSVMLFAPRRFAALPMLAMACFVAPAQRVVIMGLDFNLIRVMVLFGWLRVLLRLELRSFQWHVVDFFLLAFPICRTLIYTLQKGTSSAFIYQCGESFDVLGIYFLFRMFFRSWSDVTTTIRGIVWLSLPVLAAFIVENRTGRNLFAFLGGVPEFTKIREGRLRCQGAFAHAILAGTFWAALAPMIGALFWRGERDRLFAVVGILACVALVGLCASSTPVAALFFALVAAFMWPLRHQMRPIQLGIAALLIVLHLIMQAPVWHLISRIDLVGGSTGWHRYNLFNQFVEHFGEWALIGLNSTAHWGVIDITNQFVLEGLRGGLLTLLLFLAIVVLSFREVGRLWRNVQDSTEHAILAWSFGVALFVHVTSFFAVSYFGQIILIWYMLLAMIVCMGQASVENQDEPGECFSGVRYSAAPSGALEGPLDSR